MREASYIRQQLRDRAEFNRLHRWTKPILLEAVRNVQAVCPPRPSQQSKAYLERIVRGALDLDDENPIKMAMQSALAEAIKYHAAKKWAASDS